MAKRLDAAYAAGTREAMVKVKLAHTADCVVGGFRYEHATGTASKQVGSLLLGLYDDAGRLHHIGFCSALASSTREAWTRRLEALAGGPGFTGHAPGGPSRWSRGRDTSYVSLRHELVVEVSYDHASGGRFRHGTSFVRARPDKRPDQCRMEQLGVTAKRAA
jgi:ATP-dependent DNA ligase